MEKEQLINLTSAEISNLWNTYMNDSLASCVLSYFSAKTKDSHIKMIVEKALNTSQKHIQILSDIYTKEKHPIPQGFGKQDVNLDVPPLFMDTFYLHYIKQMSRIGLAAYSFGLSLAVRSDMRDFFTECIHDSIHLDQEVTEILLNKGLYIRAPYISKPEKVEFVHKPSFINGLVKTKHRPLLGIEITHLYANIQTNALGKSLLMGFSQVAQDKDVREFMVRGRDIASKQIEVLGGYLNESHLKTPMTWNDTVTESTASPFSDKLMMFHVNSIIAIGVADYGASLAITMRKDVALAYTRMAAEVASYAEAGANIMIKNEWMEQPPQALDRDALANK